MVSVVNNEKMKAMTVVIKIKNDGFDQCNNDRTTCFDQCSK